MDIDTGIDLQLGDQVYRLEPTLGAMRRINRHCGSLVDAARQCQRIDFDAIVLIAAAGAGLDRSASERLEREILEAGVMHAVPACGEFISLLMDPHGRSPIAEEPDSGKE